MIADIPGVLESYPPATPEAIDRLRAELGLELPDEYRSLLAQSDGIDAASFTVYPSDRVAERNQTYEVATYAPGHLTIGDDGGGRAIVLRAGRDTSPVFMVGHGSMNASHFERVADSLSGWIRSGCPLDADD